MCRHNPPCPAPNSTKPCSAHVRAAHPEQGWCLLCNGVILFDDGGAILPDGALLAPPPNARGTAAA